MNKCYSCSNEIFVKYSYDNHVFKFRFKILIKLFLRNIDFLIPNFSLFKKIKRISSTIFKGKIKVCTNCGFGEADYKPSNDKLKEYYEDFYWTSYRNKSVKFNDYYLYDERAIHQTNTIKNNINININEILEIGGADCNASLNLKESLKNNKIKIYNCDSLIWKNYCDKNNINHLSTEEFSKSKKKFDLIISSHQLEHVRDITEALTNFINHLKKGGYIFIEVPNTNFIYWNMPILDTPHLYFFTKKSLQNCLEKFELDLISVQTFGNSYEDLLNKKKQNYEIHRDDGAYLKALFKKKY